MNTQHAYDFFQFSIYKNLHVILFNTQYGCYATIVFALKMQYVSEMFGLKMMVKIGLEKIFLKSLHAGSM